MGKKPYSRDSLERALIHHGVNYSPPDRGGRTTWLIYTCGPTGIMAMTTPQVHAYVTGLADKARRVEAGELYSGK